MVITGRNQRTIEREVTFSGIGLHTGDEVIMHLLPASIDTGIFFQRIDLPGAPKVPASLAYVRDTSRSTMIGLNHCTVQTVEHLLAAARATGIDNLCIQLTAGEPPIADGSALPFIHLLEKAGQREQEGPKRVLQVREPIYHSEGNVHLVALPSEEYRISYTLHYPHSKMIGSQFFSFVFSYENFKEQIASSRTFTLYEEIAPLLERGLIKGGNLENALVIKDDQILSKEGLRYKDEMVRHKVLDLIGDLSLVGAEIKAHVIAICSGHRSNVAFGKELFSHCSDCHKGVVDERVFAN